MNQKALLKYIRQGREDPRIFARKVLGIDLNEIQEKWLLETTNRDDRKHNILVPSNQCGKTFVCAVKHIWHCFYKPYSKGDTEEQKEIEPYYTLNISPNSNQVKIMYQYMLQILRGEMSWTDKEGKGHINDCQIDWFVEKTTQNPMPVIHFKNGSVFYGRSVHDDRGKGLQGSQYAYISYDECPLSHHLKDEIAGNIMSRLISYGGDLDLLGTPNSESPSNQYYMKIVKLGLEEKQGWFAMRGKLDDNFFIPEKNREAIKKSIKSVNPEQYKQVVYGDFVEAGSGYFTPDQVNGLFDANMVFSEPRPERHYVIGADFAVTKNDYTVYTVIDDTDDIWKVVHIRRFQGNEYSPDDQVNLLKDIKQRYNMAALISDAGAMGGKMFAISLGGFITEEFKAGGTGEAKKKMLVDLKQTLAEQRLKSPEHDELREELGTYKLDDDKIQQDMVMSIGMAVHYIRKNVHTPTKPIRFNIFR